MRLPDARQQDAPAWLVWAALWIVYIVWGSTYLAIRVVVETIPPLLGMGVRFLVAGILMYGFLAIRRGPAGVKASRREIGAASLIGLLLLLGGNGVVSIAEQEVPSGLAALLIASTPLWVVLLRYLARERVSRGTLVGVAVGFVGVGVLVLGGDRPENAPLSGIVLLLFASLSWGSGSFLSKRVPLPSDPLTSTSLQMLCGGALMTLAGVLSGEMARADVSEFSTGSVVALAYLVGIGSLLAFTAYVWVLQHAPISKVATYAYVNPVIAIFLGWFLLSEEITVTMLVGAAVIVASVAFIVRKESRPPDTHVDVADAAPPALATADA